MTNTRLKTCLLATTLASLTALSASDADACGGLFCNAAQPVNQVAERIIFADNGDGTVTAVIEIQYQGPSESFAWVLPVPDGDLDIGVSSKMTLDRLDQQSNPNYQLNRVFRDECPVSRGGTMATAGSTSGGGVPGAGLSDTSGPSVVVVEEGTAGPYIYQVLSVSEDASDPAADLVEWLQEEEYDVDDSMTELLEPYLESGLNMLAFKLDKNQDVGSIRPAMITYESDVPFIPLRPTAMAALEDMGVKVWVLGSSRAVPTTYLHLELNESLINWFNPNSNYNDVVIAAANEAGGMGFVTEQSGPAAAFVDVVYTDDPDLPGSDAWRRDQLATTNFGTGAQSYQAFFNAAIGNFIDYDGFLEVMGDPEVVPLREGATVTQFVSCVDCYFSEESGAGAVYPSTPFDPETDPILEFDAFAFLDAIDDRILGPMALTQALFEDASHVTRMYTTISPDEMLEDPAFDFNPELEDIDNQHIAEQLLECNGTDWTITLPQGMQITGSGNTWPINSNSDMPANLRIVQLSAAGEGMEVEDNSAAVASLLIDLGVGEATDELTDPGSSSNDDDDDDAEDDRDPDDDDSDDDSNDDDETSGSDGGTRVTSDGASDDDGCGCRAVGHNPSGSGWLASVLLLGLALRRRIARG